MPTPPIDIQKYLTMDLFDELNMATLAPEEKAAFFESFATVVYQKILLRLMKELTPEQSQKLQGILAAEPVDTAALASFYGNDVPDFRRFAEEEIAEYKKTLVERMKT